ncbi:MAG: hypothetical protein AB1646_09285 [Thermodesulfobacteriota bacterium]
MARVLVVDDEADVHAQISSSLAHKRVTVPMSLHRMAGWKKLSQNSLQARNRATTLAGD